MSKVNIEVTEEDARFGQRNHFFKCPIALALRRRFGKGASVNLTSVHLPKAREDIPLPPHVVYKRECYDKSGYLKPFVFQVEVPDAGERNRQTHRGIHFVSGE